MKTEKTSALLLVKTGLFLLLSFSFNQSKSQSQIACSFQVDNQSSCTVEFNFEWLHYNGSNCYSPSPNCGPFFMTCPPGITTLFNDALCCSGAVDVSFQIWDPNMNGGSGGFIPGAINMGCTNTPTSSSFTIGGCTYQISISSTGITIQ